MSDDSRGKNEDGKLLYCSFCGKSQHEVRKLIAGPSVFICDECVELCNDIIREELEDASETGNQYTEAFKAAVADENAEVLYISASIEADIAELERKRSPPSTPSSFCLGGNRTKKTPVTTRSIFCAAPLPNCRSWT